MSFASEIKIEISSQQIKNTCCRKAFLDGIVAAKGRAENGNVIINLENDVYAAYASKLIVEFYGRNPVVSSLTKGGRCKQITFNSKSALRYISDLENGEKALFVTKCNNCQSYFLKGYFFGCGNITDPKKQFLIEFCPSNESLKFQLLLLKLGIELNSTNRNGKTKLYLKKSQFIEDFLVYAGLNGASFALMNAKIENELRNNVNRVANCETNNIDKSTRASHKQISIIEELDKANLLSSLPEELEKTARLRLEKRDLSLSQLAAISVPSISKSGLSHRLNKIIEIAGQLLSGIDK